MRGCFFRPAVMAMAVAMAAVLGACSPGSDGPDAIRLVDEFSHVSVSVEVSPPPAPPPVEWRFEAGDKPASGGWSAAARVDSLRLTEEGLSGRSSGAFPAIVLVREEPAGVDDRLYEVVLRLRVSKGSTLSLATLGPDGPPTPALASGERGLTLSTPILPGDDFQIYTIALDRSFGLGPLVRSGITRLLLRPSDEAGAEFTLASARLRFRKERLASIPTGIGWHGLGEIWRDTVVSRAPQELTWTLELPPNPWLDLSLGTVSEGAVGFDVRVGRPGDASELVHAETLTSAEEWRPRRIDLDRWAGREVEVTLAARGEEGTLAFWGSPVVRHGREPAAEPERARGVIVVLADTLRKHHLGAYGHKRANTPHLGRLAEEGVLFRDAIAQATWTKVSVPSILSSVYPMTHQIVTFNDRLPASIVTMAEAFQTAGFATWASSSVPFSGQLTNLHQGVEVLYEVGSTELPENVSSSKTGRFFVDELIPWLESHRDVPFYAFVHAMDPHSPFRPYAPYDTVWTDEAAAARWEADLEKVRPHIQNPTLRRFGMPTRQEMQAAGVEVEPYVEHERRWYDASILALDAEVGRLMETLRRLGRDKDTVVAFVSDHGEEFLEHGSHWHGLSVYAEMIEVPLLLHGPSGVPAGREVKETVQTLDLMPTLLELAGLEVPATAQGRSLRTLWNGGGERRPPAIAERQVQLAELSDAEDAFVRSDSIALVEPEWKLIWNYRQGPGVPEYELFNRQEDPMDQNNLAAERPELVARLFERVESWRQAAIAARPADQEAAAEGLSAEELERLRSLGYL